MTIATTIAMLRRQSFPGMLVGGILLLAQAASAQSWTTAATACVPDESSVGLYQFDDATVTINGSAPTDAAVKLRCNIPSPEDVTASSSPSSWNRMQVGYTDPGGSTEVKVQLVRVTKTTGAVWVMATFTSVTAAAPTVGSATIASAFDFTTYVYYVGINLTRTSGSSTPSVWFVSVD